MTVTGGIRPDAARRDDAVARFRALAAIARVGPGDRDGVLAQVAEAAREALDAASASLSVFEPDRGQVRCLVNVGDLGPDEVPTPVDEVYSMLDFDNLALLIDGQQGVVVSLDQGDQTHDYVALLHGYGKGSCLSVPVPLDGRVWGELFATRRVGEPAFDDGDLDFAVAVGAQVGAALAAAERIEQVQRLAYTDPLTHLANRRAVDEWLDQAFARRAADDSPVGLLVCDLNGLKRINDEQGHAVGDRALVRFAGLLSTAAAQLPGAIAARLGGDEFCVAVAGVPSDVLVAAAEELCRLVLRSPLEGVSCGVACTADDVGPVESPSRLFRLADAAQYRAKRSRSQRPVVAGRTLPPEATVSDDGHPLRPRDRRTHRARATADLARLLSTGLEVLDELPGAAPSDRLAALADHLTHRLDGLGWWLSLAPAGAGVVRTVRYALIRSQPGVRTQPGGTGALGEEFALDDYPVTRALVDGGACVQRADDPGADPAEVAILDGMGAVGVAMAGARTPDGDGWLLEVFADELTLPLGDLAGVLRALVLVAVSDAVPRGPSR